MVETLAVLLLIVVLVSVSWLSVLVSWQAIVVAGAACALAGLCVGLPTSLYYHLRLHRALNSRGLLPAGWWWSPMRYHSLLLDRERPVVMRWFYAGASSFGLIVLGCVLSGLGLLLAH
jgi:hypothetical protein